MTLREPWRTRLLFGSFALNLFLAGMMATHLHRPHEHGPPNAEAIIDHMTHAMRPEDAARFRAVMERNRVQTDDARARMEAARRAMSHAMGEPHYDEAAVRAAMQAWQTDWMAWSQAVGDGILQALAQVSPEGRRSLAEAEQRHDPPR